MTLQSGTKLKIEPVFWEYCISACCPGGYWGKVPSKGKHRHTNSPNERDLCKPYPLEVQPSSPFLMTGGSISCLYHQTRAITFWIKYMNGTAKEGISVSWRWLYLERLIEVFWFSEVSWIVRREPRLPHAWFAIRSGHHRNAFSPRGVLVTCAVGVVDREYRLEKMH